MNKLNLKSFLTPKAILIETALVVLVMFVLGEIYLDSELSKIAKTHSSAPKAEPQEFEILVEQYSLLESNKIQPGYWVGKTCGTEECSLNPENYLKHTLEVSENRISLTYEIYRNNKVIYNTSIFGTASYQGQTVRFIEPGGSKGLLFEHSRFPFSIQNFNEIKIWVDSDSPIILEFEDVIDRVPTRKRNPLEIETAKVAIAVCGSQDITCLTKGDNDE